MASRWKNHLEILSFEAFIILVEALQFYLKLKKNNGCFTRRYMCIFVSTLHVICEILLRAKICVIAVSNNNGTHVIPNIVCHKSFGFQDN